MNDRRWIHRHRIQVMRDNMEQCEYKDVLTTCFFKYFMHEGTTCYVDYIMATKDV